MMLAALAACSPKAVEPAPIRNPSGLPADAYPPRGWTTSLIPNARVARRYGVASPPRVPRAEVLIVPERQPMEAWFPVINALVSRGYSVWIADPQPAPLESNVSYILREQVIRSGSSGRLFVLGQGRGAVAALEGLQDPLGIVLWSPITRSAPYTVPSWEMKVMRGLGLGNRPLLGQADWKEGDPVGDPLAQAWMKANPRLRPTPPTYDSLYTYGQNIGTIPPTRGAIVEDFFVKPTKPSPPMSVSGGDAWARNCVAKLNCKPIAPGVEAMIAAFDEATKDVTLGAPPPPVGKKKSPAPAA